LMVPDLIDIEQELFELPQRVSLAFTVSRFSSKCLARRNE
jgi:hypothetical protein